MATQAARDDDAICASFYKGATTGNVLPRIITRRPYPDPGSFMPTEADGYERRKVFPLRSPAVLSRENVRLRLENQSIEKRFDRLYEEAYATRVQLRNIQAAAAKETLSGSNFAVSELLKLSTRIMELLARDPEEACMRFIPDVLACLAICQVRDKRLYAAGQRLRHALSCVSRASAQARRTVFQPLGRPAGTAPPDLKWLATVTDDVAWLKQAEQWEQDPLDLRWLAIAAGDQGVLLHRYAWQRAPIDLRYLTVVTGDMDWLHVGAERWSSTPPEVRLRAVVQRDPLLLWPAAASSAAHIEEEAYAVLRSAITESVPSVPYGLSPEEDLDISLQLHLASEKPDRIHSEQLLLQKEKRASAAKGVHALLSLAAPPSVAKTTVPSELSPAAEPQQGVGVRGKVLSAVSQKGEEPAFSPLIKTAGKPARPAAPASPGKKVGAAGEGEAFPKVPKQPPVSAEKEKPTAPAAMDTVEPALSKEKPSKAPAPLGAEMKTAGVTGLPRTLKSPQVQVLRESAEKETETKGTLGVPQRTPAKLAPAMLPKGDGEKKMPEPVSKKVVTPPPAAGVSKAVAEADVEQKASGVAITKDSALPKSLSAELRKGFPLKKGQAEKAAEAPLASVKAEAAVPEKAKEGVKAAGKKVESAGVPAPAVEKLGVKKAPPVLSQIGGPPGKGPPTTKTSAPASPAEKKEDNSTKDTGGGKQSIPKKAAPSEKQSAVSQTPEGGEGGKPPTVARMKKLGMPSPKGPPPPKEEEGRNGKGDMPPKPPLPGEPSLMPQIAEGDVEGKAAAVVRTKKLGVPPPKGPPSVKEKEAGDGEEAMRTKASPQEEPPLVPQVGEGDGERKAPAVARPKKLGMPPPKGALLVKEKKAGDDKESAPKKPPLPGKASLMPQTGEGTEAEKAFDLVSSKKSGRLPIKELQLPAKAPISDASAKKVPEDPRAETGSDETSAKSRVSVAEDTVKKETPSPKKVPPKPGKSSPGGPAPAEKGDAQQQQPEVQPGKPPQLKKAPGLPPKKMAPPTIPFKKAAPPPT